MNKQAPKPNDERVAWTYWITRDSIQGELSGQCQLWHRKPTRVKHGYRITWVATDHRDPGHLGEFRPEEIDTWFRVCPETDLELVRVETYPTAADLARQATA